MSIGLFGSLAIASKCTALSTFLRGRIASVTVRVRHYPQTNVHG